MVCRAELDAAGSNCTNWQSPELGAHIVVDLERVNLERVYGSSAGDKLCAALARKALDHSFAVLRENPTPDTFAGRKTQEPFPQLEKHKRAEEY